MARTSKPPVDRHGPIHMFAMITPAIVSELLSFVILERIPGEEDT